MYFMDSDEDYEDYGDIDSEYNFIKYVMGNYDDIFGEETNDEFSEKVEDEDSEYESDEFTHASDIKNMKRCQAMYAKLNENRNEGLFCDAILSVENKTYPVHKAVLTAASSYFRAMFTGCFVEKNADCIEIKGVSEPVFNILLEYMYGGKLNLQFESIRDIYMGADMLCIDTLIEDCKLFFKENWEFASDVNSVYEMAKEFEFNEIVAKIISTAQKGLHCFTGNYKTLPFEFVCKVLEDRPAFNRPDRELKMAVSVIEWAFHKPDERLPEKMLELLSHLHFHFISESDINKIIDQFCNYDDNLKVELKVQQTFKDEVNNLYIKSHKTITVHNIELVFLDRTNKDGMSNVFVFNSSTWKWDTKPYQIGFMPESALVKGDDIYVFGPDGGAKLNTRFQSSVKLPSLPVKRTRFMFNIVNNNVYLTGGVRKDRSSKGQGEILELKPNHKEWKCRMTWFKSKCNASTISVNHCLYIVGGFFPDTSMQNESTEVFMYNTLSNYFKKVCVLPYPIQRPKLVAHDGVLYIFTSRFNIVERIDLKTGHHVPAVIVEHPLSGCSLFDLISVQEGIIAAIYFDEDIALGLLKPSENLKFELLGFLPMKNSGVEISSSCLDFLFLRKVIPS